MKMNTLSAAVTAALVGLSTVAFGQSGSGPSGQDSATTQSGAANSGTAVGGSSNSKGSMSGATKTTPDCDALTGSAKTRCQRDHASSSGSSATPSVTKSPAQSGPGTSDRTEPRGQPGVGTSSAGS